MPETQTGKILRVHVSEHDQYEGKPLYEAIVHRCKELKIAGAAVFRGLEGFGESAGIHCHHMMRKDQPIVRHDCGRGDDRHVGRGLHTDREGR